MVLPVRPTVLRTPAADGPRGAPVSPQPDSWNEWNSLTGNYLPPRLKVAAVAPPQDVGVKLVAKDGKAKAVAVPAKRRAR